MENQAVPWPFLFLTTLGVRIIRSVRTDDWPSRFLAASFSTRSAQGFTAHNRAHGSPH